MKSTQSTKSTKRMETGFACALLAVAADAQESADSTWCRFRGPNGSGVLDGAGLPESFEHLRWRTPVPSGFSSPVLGTRFVFATAHEGVHVLTLAFDRETGAEAWRCRAPRDMPAPMGDVGNNPVSGTPATDGENAYVFASNYGLLSYDAEGRTRWERELAPFRAPWGMGTSPVLAGDLLILQCDQDSGAYLLALEKDTGEQRWKTMRPEVTNGFASPVLHRARDGGVELIAASSHSITGFDLKQGQKLWSMPGLAWQAKTTPVLDAERIYASWNAPDLSTFGLRADPGAWDAALAANDRDKNGRLERAELTDAAQIALWDHFDLDAGGAIDEREWSTLRARARSSNGMQALLLEKRHAPEAEHVAWTHRRSLPDSSSPLLYRGRLYCIKDGGILTVLCAADGTVLSSERVPGAEGAYFASPIACDGRILLADHGGIVTLLREGDRPEVLAQHSLGEPIVATPAIGSACIYVRTYRALYCFARRPVPDPQGQSAAPVEPRR